MFYKLIFSLLTIFSLFDICQAAPLPQMQEKVISANGAQLYCQYVGNGNPIIVVHGAPPLSQDYLLPFLSELSENNMVVFYDQRGCGHSTSELTEKQVNVPTFVEDIESIRHAFHFDKITVLGHSWGSFLAMQYVIRHPDAVDKLILIGTMPASQDELFQFISDITKRLAPVHDEIELIKATDLYKSGDPETVEKELKIVFQTYLYNPEDINKLNFRLPQQGILTGLKTFDLVCSEVFFKPFNIFNELSAIKCPTLILHGDSDPISYRMAEHINQTIPNSKFMKIDNCGHFPYVEQPCVMFSTIKAFL